MTLETVIAFALRNPIVMDQLGEALRSDLVNADPYKRRLVEFADTFLLQRRRLPGAGDWDVWLESLEEGSIRDGTREALGRMLGIDTSSYDPEFFAPQVLAQLRQGAAQVAKARLNEVPIVTPELFAQLSERLADIESGSLQGLARLADIDTWAAPVREDNLINTGYATLNRYIGGWGKELWMVFADSGVGKSMLLQNFAANAARSGRKVLHVSLELGIRPQVHRYYRQLAQATKAEFATDIEEVKRRLRHWFKFSKGSIYLLEFPAYGLDTASLHRVIERASRVMDGIDMLVLDYLDLLSPSRHGRGGAYEDLGRLTHETRALCSQFDITVLTASQAVRRPESSKRLTQRDMGDSYQKVRGADGLLGLSQLPEEEEVHQGRLGIIKVRDSGGRGQEIALYMNRELSYIAELDHPNTRALIAKLGHQPGRPQPKPEKPKTGKPSSLAKP